MSASSSLKITEIFFSLQGETSRIGIPTIFIRLTGCPLRCVYCDSAYAFYGDDVWSIDNIMARIADYPSRYVTVTGGEPLAQKNCHVLLKALCDAGYQVSLETSGALDIADVDPRVAKVMDIKTPGSGEAHKTRWDNLPHLQAQDELKFVLADADDYEWAKLLLNQKQLAQICPVIFSPVYETLPPKTLAEWVLRDGLPVRVQIQLHKLLWGNQHGV